MAAEPNQDEALKTSVAGLIRRVTEGQETVFDVAPGHLTVTRRKLNPEPPMEPVHAEAQARGHQFHTHLSLADYLVRYGSSRTVVYADQPAGVIYAVLDEEPGSTESVVAEEIHGGVSHSREVLTCVPQVHPLWAPWAEISGQHVAMDDFVDLVSKHRRVIVEPSGRALVFTLSQIRIAVSLEVQKGRGRESINGLMVTTSVEGRTSQEAVPFPDQIKVRAPMFVGQPAFDVELDLTVTASRDGKAFVHVSAGTVDEAKERAFEAMVDKLREALKEKRCVVTLGKPQQVDWKYLPQKA
jgi:hypothetical protein